MASAKQQETLLLTEHFTWPPISLIDDIINNVNEVLYKCTDALESGLAGAGPQALGFAHRAAEENRVPEKDESGKDVFPEAQLELDEGMLRLETLLEGAIDRNFDKLEIWTLRNVLCLPAGLAEWVRLGHYEGLSIPKGDPTTTPETLHALRRKLAETQKLHAALQAEKARNEAQIQRLRALLQPPATKREPRSSTSPKKERGGGAESQAPFAFLTHPPAAQKLGLQALPLASASTSTSAESRTPLTTHTTFTTSQLPYLRQLLASLKPHLATAALPLTKEGEKEALARERKTYIESQSRRVLERRGVDTRNGVEGIGQGQRVRGDEVAALEGIAGRLGRGDGDGDGEEMDTS